MIDFVIAILSSSVLATVIGKVIDFFSSRHSRVEKKIDGITNTLTDHIAEYETEKADNSRRRILRFSDEVRRNLPFSKEMLENVLEDIDVYEAYCREHEGYKNSKAVEAIKNVRDVYHEYETGVRKYL